MGKVMIDVVSINMVTEPFVAKGIIEIVEKHYHKIPDKIWLHIVNKVLMLGDEKWKEEFSECLKKFPSY